MSSAHANATRSSRPSTSIFLRAALLLLHAALLLALRRTPRFFDPATLGILSRSPLLFLGAALLLLLRALLLLLRAALLLLLGTLLFLLGSSLLLLRTLLLLLGSTLLLLLCPSLRFDLCTSLPLGLRTTLLFHPSLLFLLRSPPALLGSLLRLLLRAALLLACLRLLLCTTLGFLPGALTLALHAALLLSLRGQLSLLLRAPLCGFPCGTLRVGLSSLSRFFLRTSLGLAVCSAFDFGALLRFDVRSTGGFSLGVLLRFHRLTTTLGLDLLLRIVRGSLARGFGTTSVLLRSSDGFFPGSSLRLGLGTSLRVLLRGRVMVPTRGFRAA